MSDWVIIRIDLEDPDEVEAIKMVANVPADWKKYMKKLAKKDGRYVVSKLLYELNYFKPESAMIIHKRIEKESE